MEVVCSHWCYQRWSTGLVAACIDNTMFPPEWSLLKGEGGTCSIHFRKKIPPWSVHGKSFEQFLERSPRNLDFFEFVKRLQVIFDRNKIFWCWKMTKDNLFQNHHHLFVYRACTEHAVNVYLIGNVGQEKIYQTRWPSY